MESSVLEVRQKSQRPHLAYLDGIRGLAALYVTVFHLMMTQDLAYHLPRPIFLLTSWLRYGHYAVDVFIVLSGYCLMLPVLHSEVRDVPGGKRDFFMRRAWRIVPPYWAALVFTLLVILVARLGNSPVRADDGTVFHAGNLISHGLLVHNWFPHYSDSINLPMWTVAVEWQIYFVFALVLLPVWRRLGITCAVLLAILLGQLPRLILPDNFNLDWMRPWYVGLFALGMGAACMRSPIYHAERCQRWPIGLICFALFVIVLGIEIIRGEARSMEHLWAKDVLIGLAAASFLAWLGRPETPPLKLVFTSLLQHRLILGLGMISYSLYLIHLPMMWVVKFVIGKLHLTPYAEFAFRLTIAPLLILPVAYVFYRLFEKPVLSRRAKRRHHVELTTAKTA